MINPLVSVLMPVFNGENHLREAIESILCQTYKNLEFLIINDGSTDKTEEIILSYQDERIKYVKNETNIKLIASLNKGLQLAKGIYIVRMDADDISIPNRIEKQVLFMNENPQVAIVGSWIKTLPNFTIVKFESNPELLKVKMLFSSAINHPTTLIRKEFIQSRNLKYPAEWLHAEDYALWLDIVKAGGNFAIIPEVLLCYRVHESNIGVLNHDTQKMAVFNLRKQILLEITPQIDDYEYKLFNHFITVSNNEFFSFYDDTLFKQKGDLKILGNLLSRLINGNDRRRLINPKIFACYLAKKFLPFCIEHSNLGIEAYTSYFGNKFHTLNGYPLKNRIFLFIKAILQIPPHQKIKYDK